MESDLPQHQRFVHDHNQHQTNSGLMRYRSAPSSYFTSAMDREFSEQFLSKPLSPETERIFSRFIDAGDGTEDSSTAQNLYEIQKHPPPPPPLQITEANTSQRQAQYLSSNYSPASQSSSYQFPSKPPLPNQNLGTSIDGLPRMRDGGDGAGRGGVNSNLIRHNSSPAGLFANIDVESVYGGTRTGIGNYGGKEETSFSPGCRLNNYISRLPSSSSGLMSPIAEIEDKSNIIASWDDSAILSATNIQNQTQNEEGGGNRPVPLLAHHLSLPKTAAEMSVIENFLQYSESIPCKVRAKRGCATHPRSIAERVRRTKISERMRKLQELVPNMDKQTNTSDMLDLAVDYIKDLQKQVQILSENRAKCKCTSRQK